jgi:hypothetical protein
MNKFIRTVSLHYYLIKSGSLECESPEVSYSEIPKSICGRSSVLEPVVRIFCEYFTFVSKLPFMLMGSSPKGSKI